MAARSRSLDHPANPGSADDQRQEYLVYLDPGLVDRVLELTDVPGTAIEEGLQLWLAKQAALPTLAAPSAPARSLPVKARSLDLAANPAAAQDDLPKPMRRPNIPTGTRQPPRRSIGPGTLPQPIHPTSSNDDETGWLV